MAVRRHSLIDIPMAEEPEPGTPGQNNPMPGTSSPTGGEYTTWTEIDAASKLQYGHIVDGELLADGDYGISLGLPPGSINMGRSYSPPLSSAEVRMATFHFKTNSEGKLPAPQYFYSWALSDVAGDASYSHARALVYVRDGDPGWQLQGGWVEFVTPDDTIDHSTWINIPTPEPNKDYWAAVIEHDTEIVIALWNVDPSGDTGPWYSFSVPAPDPDSGSPYTHWQEMQSMDLYATTQVLSLDTSLPHTGMYGLSWLTGEL